MQLLSGDGYPSEKFWALEERIRSDKSTPGVRLQLDKSETGYDLVLLMNDGVITEADLDGFSEELKEYVLRRVKH